MNREQRRHQALQIRQKKRDEILAKKRSLGGLEYAPFLITIVPLTQNLDTTTALNILSQCDEEAIVNKSSQGNTHISLPRFKQRFEFVTPQCDHDFSVLDTLKVSDTVLFLISAATGLEDNENVIDQWGEKILMTSFSQVSINTLLLCSISHQ